MPNETQEFHTGLFIEQKKWGVLQIIQDLLRSQYHLVAVTGPQLPNHTCEVLLRPLTIDLSGLNFPNAQALLKRYLSMIKESRPKMFVVKEPEFIDLGESDDEPMDEASVVIVDLDETHVPDKKSEDESSLNISKSNSPSKSPHSSTGADNVLKHSQDCEEKINPIINFDSDVVLVDSEENPISCPKSPPSDIINTGDALRDLAKSLSWKQGTKRKKDLDKVCDKSVEVVEILDDDIIVIDDSFTTSTTSRDHNRLSECEVLVVEPSKIPDAAIHKLPQSENKLPPVRTSVDIEGASDLSTHLPPPDTSQSTSVTKIAENESENSCVDNSESSGPPKKKSRLAYHRPAHLVTPLTQTTSAVPSTKIDSGSNIYNPNADIAEKRTGLRPIVIDGNNVAIGHGKGTFSLKGIQICINYFEKRGHRQIKVFIPQYRRNRDNHDELQKMERKGLVVMTPSRKVNGKILASYDDRYIVQYAAEFGGVIVSADNFRDLLSENPSWRETIENRLLMFTWVDDLLMFPQDPLGRRGPSLDDFLKFPDT